MMRYLFALAPLAVLSAAGCESGTEPLVEGTVAVRFAGPIGTEGGQSSDLIIQGSNGTLTLTDVRIVVDDFELKRENDIAECDAAGRADVCADLEVGPALVDLPLTAGVTVIGQQAVPGAEYEEIEFDVVDLQGPAAGLLAQARALPGYSQWPANASIAARGTFRDAQSGQTRPFTVYFALDSAVELEFGATRLDLSDGGSGTVTIHVDPIEWLTLQGNVADLSFFDYESTGRVASLSFSLQAGLDVVVEN